MPSSTQIRLSSAYSMGKARRLAPFVNDKTLLHVPAPSKYDPPTTDKTSKTNKVPSWSQSKEKRFFTPQLKTPGPGSYDIP